MSKYFKIILASLMCFVLVFLAACGKNSLNENNDDDDQNQGKLTFKTEQEVKASLKNYSFKYNYTFNDGTKTSDIVITDMRCENGWYFAMGEVIYIADYDNNAFYTLDTKDKIGALVNLTEENKNTFEFSKTYLFSWYENAGSFKKDGSAVVADRSCNKFTYNVFTLKYTYYIDKEYDICLKYEIESQGNKTSMSFAKFKIGGVTIEDIKSDIKDYQIDDYRAIV